MPELKESLLPIPVTVIAGFLGAGKTTLLNRILRAHHGWRVAVLVNDFGKINIDTQLLEMDGTGRMIGLPNGCICCTLYSSVITVIQKLVDRPEPPEHILIEASGVSTPENIASIMETPSLQRFVTLDSMITLIDAENVRRLASAVSFIENQIGSADILLVNKTDLVSPTALAELLAWVRQIAPEARIIPTSHADVPLELLLGAARHDPAGEPAFRLDDHDHAEDHSQGYGTWDYTTARPLSRPALHELLDHLPASVYRAKGILYLADTPGERHILQVVGRRISLHSGGPWGEQPPGSQLVFIGQPDAFEPDAWQARLEKCVAE